ncbi:MAG TPA: hypothetical protein VGL72_20390 [Bryobacteraceae bacterium]
MKYGQRSLLFHLAVCIATTSLCVVAAHGQATQPSDSGQSSAAAASAPNYSGNLLTRSTLTGDWGGVRNELAQRGMTFDLSVTQIYEGVTGGGTQSGPLGILPRPGANTRNWEYNGIGDFVFNLDTGKAKLWQGGFLTLEVEGEWGNNAGVNKQSGGLDPVNFIPFTLRRSPMASP